MIPKQLPNLPIYPHSVVEIEKSTFFMTRTHQGKRLGIAGPGPIDGFSGERQGTLLLCPLTPGNANALRKRLLWLRPVPLFLKTSAGCGDRLGCATPGHVRAFNRFQTVAPIFAQQSVRENARTGRTPQQVIDDATWGVFQEGWRAPWGADADHLKVPADVDAFVSAGYTFYTIDPGAHVDNQAHTATLGVLQSKALALPWDELDDSLAGLRARYLGQAFDLEGASLDFDEVSLTRAAAKYGRAIAHTARMYRHLLSLTANSELEVSVDETETPTSIAEHFFIASELKRLGVQWVSLAPRYVGRFEKGVDYIGDLGQFETELAQHAAVARVLGPYKLSIHSGSDKFSIYPIIARLAQGRVHVKTAGTSYLEALRAIGRVEPSLFREIMAFARSRYDEERVTYHVSARLNKLPELERLTDVALPGLLDQFDARQILHVTYGSTLDIFGARLKAILDGYEEVHYAALETHFGKHLSPFV